MCACTQTHLDTPTHAHARTHETRRGEVERKHKIQGAGGRVQNRPGRQCDSVLRFYGWRVSGNTQPCVPSPCDSSWIAAQLPRDLHCLCLVLISTIQKFTLCVCVYVFSCTGTTPTDAIIECNFSKQSVNGSFFIALIRLQPQDLQLTL